MSDTGNNCDNKPQQEDVNLEESQAEAVPEVENKPVTPVKRTPSKRLSAVERAQRESEELVKTLGGSLDIEGGRKTRSSTRGTPSKSSVISTPPPTKRARAATAATPKRGRGRKLETTIEDDVKASPEKAPSEPESSNHEEKETSAVVDVPKAQEIAEDDKTKSAAETASEVAVEEEDEKPSPAKQEDKPEAMEVDGVSKETSTEPKQAEESTQNECESSSKPNDDELKKSEKVVSETVESSNTTTTTSNTVEVADLPPTTDVEEKIPVENKSSDDATAYENNVTANDVKVNSNSLPTDVSLPIPTPTPTPDTQISVAGNEHKAESNDLCEPKIASPPITANNDGATPQYCN